MDRFDEKKDREDADEMARAGDVLGLGGGPVPKTADDPTASNDPESIARRHERAREEEETLTSRRDDPYRQSPGATGIDMGAGGRGTDVSGE